MTKHYAERDLLEMDRAGEFYGNHVMAMTAEQLHSKSDIAAELGWRDMQIANLKEQLTATTNSLTNAQEALKSAGIEADTVQAGVMELVSRMNQVVAKGKELAEEAAYVYGKYNDEMAPDMVCDGQTIQEFFDVANSTKTTDAYLNAVRAEGVEMFANHCLKRRGEMMKTEPNEAVVNQAITAIRRSGEFALHFAAQLRAGNAGKDGSHE
ncbi:hypothetical protein MXF26_12485 [Pantoea dispersa]|uniref:hypothetical protein n=1 Tax=Pantoea dispersa TaxID=59814 RepID=UPI002DBD286F|nr:hypothetical protein [Pantoea dispersa]MEB5837069.1 hypothetical protein [Pantoea dispersa]